MSRTDEDIYNEIIAKITELENTFKTHFIINLDDIERQVDTLLDIQTKNANITTPEVDAIITRLSKMINNEKLQTITKKLDEYKRNKIGTRANEFANLQNDLTPAPVPAPSSGWFGLFGLFGGKSRHKRHRGRGRRLSRRRHHTRSSSSSKTQHSTQSMH